MEEVNKNLMMSCCDTQYEQEETQIVETGSSNSGESRSAMYRHETSNELCSIGQLEDDCEDTLSGSGVEFVLPVRRKMLGDQD